MSTEIIDKPPVRKGLGNTADPNNPNINTDWRSTITDETLRANPTIANLKADNASEAINALSQQLVHAQGMVGAEKVLRPKQEWTPEQHKEWRKDVLGVPDSADGYKLETLKLPEGIAEMPKEFRDAFISQVALQAGMSDSQASLALQFVLNSDAQMSADSAEKTKAQADKQLLDLQTKWGDKYDAQMQIAEFGLKNTADPELVKMISDDPILSTHPLLTDHFYKVGQMLQSDSPAGLIENQAPLGSKAQALAAIREMELSDEYLKYINPKTYVDPTERIKKEALFKRRTELYAAAYEGEAVVPVS